MKSHRSLTLWRIVHTGIVNFMRNVSLAVAAMAVMVVTLTIVLFSLITNATFANTIAQITAKIDVSVYLQDSVSDSQAKNFANQIAKRPDVAKVVYLNKTQALNSYIQQISSNTDLVTAATETGNPIPATIQVFPKD